MRQATQMSEIFEALVQFAKAIYFDQVIVTIISPDIHEELIDVIFFVYENWTDRTIIEEQLFVAQSYS